MELSKNDRNPGPSHTHTIGYFFEILSKTFSFLKGGIPCDILALYLPDAARFIGAL